MLIMPRVTTKGAMRPMVISRPLASPQPMPMTSASRMTGRIPAPAFSVPAATAPAMAKIEPTERSIPPVRMTKVMPTAMMPKIELWRTTLSTLVTLRNTGERTARKMQMMKKATTMPYDFSTRLTSSLTIRRTASFMGALLPACRARGRGSSPLPPWPPPG